MSDNDRSATCSPAEAGNGVDGPGLLNVQIPTQSKKSQKRKHIRTQFDDNSLDSSAAAEQRKEKERLERLEKINAQNDHLQQMESLLYEENAAPPFIPPNFDLDGYFAEIAKDDKKPCSMFMSNQDVPSTSKPEIDYIDLSSDDEVTIVDVKEAPSRSTTTRNRWGIPSTAEREDYAQMERQYSREALRIKKMRDLSSLEDTEKYHGRLLVNAGHPEEDPDVFVAPHLTHILQPHQLGGIRFMYDNTIESLCDFKQDNGFGCILAHSMGLGKTIQVITFSEIFLRTTKSKRVLIIVPINTIQNWNSEYDKWMPRLSDVGELIRKFEVFLLGDNCKSFDQRVNMIEKWHNSGGVLLIGYDMFRMLIRQTQPKKAKKKRPRLNLNGASSSWMPDPFDEQNIVESEVPEEEFGFTSGGRVKSEAHDVLRRALLDPGPELVVCDEGHKIKNLNTDISIALGAIKTRRRIVLTGYPLQNNLMEYYCMIDFVRPKYLGSKKTFIERFEKPIKNGQCVDSTPSDIKFARQRTHVLVELVKGFVQRRTHHLLKTILPENKEYVLLFRKSNIQRMLYRSFVLYAQSEIQKQTNGNTFNPLKAFTACSKIWNHPDVLAKLIDDSSKSIKKKTEERGDWNGGSDQSSSSMPGTPNRSNSPSKKKKRGQSKSSGSVLSGEMDDEEESMPYDWSSECLVGYQNGILENGYKMMVALEIINECTRVGEKILIFSQNLTTLSLLEEFMSSRRFTLSNGSSGKWEKNRNYLRFDGSTSGSEREKLIKRFNSEPNLHVFLISTKAGSLGINLVSANRCIIMDACWNPCHDAQAVCRVYRYGQQKRTYIYRLIMDNCMERAIFNRQISKHGLQQRVVDDAQVDANITQKELEVLLVYNEALDVVHDKWDTSDWNLDDQLLENVISKYSEMLSAKPFLHESLILESEKVLSEDEKREAQLLFEREKRGDIFLPDTSNNGPVNQYSLRVGANGEIKNVERNYPPVHSSPLPQKIQMRWPNQGGSTMANHFNGYNGGGYVPGAPNVSNRDLYDQQQLQYLFSMEPFPQRFPGCATSKPLKRCNDGFVQDIMTDRALVLNMVGSNQLIPIPQHTWIQLVKPKMGCFLKVTENVICYAQATPFETYGSMMYEFLSDFNSVQSHYLNSGYPNYNMGQIRPTPSKTNGAVEVVDLD